MKNVVGAIVVCIFLLSFSPAEALMIDLSITGTVDNANNPADNDPFEFVNGQEYSWNFSIDTELPGYQLRADNGVTNYLNDGHENYNYGQITQVQGPNIWTGTLGNESHDYNFFRDHLTDNKAQLRYSNDHGWLQAGFTGSLETGLTITTLTVSQRNLQDREFTIAFESFESSIISSDNGSAPVPEPSTMLLLGFGLLGLAGISRKRS